MQKVGYLRGRRVLGKIDLDDPRLIPIEELALRRMQEKRDQYIWQGRDLEARGVGTAMLLFWLTLTEQKIESKMGDL